MTQRCVSRLIATLVATATFTLTGGCRMSAPIHVWSPPTLQSTVGKSVMVPKIGGPTEIAGPIHQQLLQSVPSDAGRSTRLLGTEELREAAGDPANEIALVSYSEEDESDLALADTARKQDVDFILRGEIVPDRRPQTLQKDSEHLVVSWRLMALDAEQQADSAGTATGMPVAVDLESALERYPDLTLAIDHASVLQTAMIRDTLPLITPSVQRSRVQLEIPYLMPGSRMVRQGNAMAVGGRWGEAESLWRKVRDRYPFSSVAIHNLAIAAVARQDFSEARKLSRKALRMKPTKLHQQTLVWVEQTQRAYHEAFDLSDPPEGWAVTRSPARRERR